VGERQVVIIQALAGHQQPASQSLLERMDCIAYPRLGRLHHNHRKVPVKDLTERGKTVGQLQEVGCGEPQCRTAHLHDPPVRWSVSLACQEKKRTDSAFAANEPSLHIVVLTDLRTHGYQPVRNKIDMFQRGTPVMKDLARPKPHFFCPGLD